MKKWAEVVKERDEAICAMLREGCHVSAVAEEIGLSAAHIRLIAQKYGLVPVRKPRAKPIPGLRKCHGVCKEYKPCAEFYNKSHRCKDCQKLWVKEHRDYTRAYNCEFQRKRRAKLKAQQQA